MSNLLANGLCFSMISFNNSKKDYNLYSISTDSLFIEDTSSIMKPSAFLKRFDLADALSIHDIVLSNIDKGN